MGTMENFDCPVCLEALKPPIFQCFNGHLLCRSCLRAIERSHNKACPTCLVLLGDRRIRCLEADRRAEEIKRPRRLSPTPRETILPESALRAVRKFSTATCPTAQPFRLALRETVFETCVIKIADEILQGPIVCAGATYQIQSISWSMGLDDFESLVEAFLRKRSTPPRSITELRDAGVYPLNTGTRAAAAYVSATDDTLVDKAVRLLQSCIAADLPHVRFVMGADRAARHYAVSPPLGTRWVSLSIEEDENKLLIIFEVFDDRYRERLDSCGVVGVYKDNNFELEVDTRRFISETDRVARLLRDVFHHLVMRVTLPEARELAPATAKFLTYVQRRIPCIEFD